VLAGHTDVRTHGQLGNIMPPPRLSVVGAGGGIKYITACIARTARLVTETVIVTFVI